jgi:hypothetical protein
MLRIRQFAARREKCKYLNRIQHLEEFAISLDIFTFLEADFFMEKATPWAMRLRGR